MFGPAHDSLMNVDRGSTHRLDRTDDDQVVAQARGPEVADRDLGHEISAAVAAQHRRLIDADGSDHVRARPLHELQIIGVIDDASGVGVLEIDR